MLLQDNMTGASQEIISSPETDLNTTQQSVVNRCLCVSDSARTDRQKNVELKPTSSCL